MVSHIFFDLHGTLVDGLALHYCYSRSLGTYLAGRFGGEASAWIEANRKVFADWDSYYADLDLTGENGIEDMWEGMVRTTRALFRIVGAPVPEGRVLDALSREIPEIATQGCDALYPDARDVIGQLHRAGYVLGVASHAVSGHGRGVLRGAGVFHLFHGPIIGPDIAGQFRKDARFYTHAARQAGVAPRCCLVVDDTPQAIAGARAAGMGAVAISRNGKAVFAAEEPVLDGLAGLLECLRV